jgi:uncharacterized lipoprotein YddW (UPF0748 family)
MFLYECVGLSFDSRLLISGRNISPAETRGGARNAHPVEAPPRSNYNPGAPALRSADRVSFRLALLATCLTLADVPAVAQSAAEYRGFWVDTFNTRLNTAEDVAAVVARARAARANLLLVQARRRGDAWYLNSAEPLPEGVTFDPDFDPLHEVVAQAHAAGIQVHAYVVVADIWNQTTLPTHAAHVFNQHGLTPAGTPLSGRANWLTRTLEADGQATSYGGYRFGTDFWIDPGHPDAAAYTVAVLSRLVANYDVDGLHLDCLQYPEIGAGNPPDASVDAGAGASVGYNDTSLERYRRRHRLPSDFVPAPADPTWTAWRREQVTALMRRIYLTATALKPTLVISLAAHAGGEAPASDERWDATEASGRVFQDWRAWMDEGIVDLAVPMVYRAEHTAFGAESFERWTTWTLQHLYGRHAAVGIGAYLNSIEGTLRQTRRALAVTGDEQGPTSRGLPPPRGVTFYSLGAHNAPVSQNPLSSSQRDTPYRAFEDLAAGLTTGRTSAGQLLEPASQPPIFATSVTTPSMPWKAQPTTGAVQGIVTASAGAPLDGAAIAIEAANGSSLVSAARTDGGGFFGHVGLAPGEYRVIVVPDGDGQYRSNCTVSIGAGAVSTVTLRVDAGSPSVATCQ